MTRSFLLLFCICSSWNLYSQNANPDNKIFFSLAGGQTNTTFSGYEIDNRLNSPYAGDPYLKHRKGLWLALQTKVTFYDYFFVKPGIAYAQKGAEEMDDNYSKYAFKADIDYLAVPLLVGIQPLNFKNIKYFNLYIEGGIVPSFEVNRENHNLDRGYSQKPTVRTAVLAYQYGGGVEFKIFRGLVVFGNYTYFKDIVPFFEVLDNPTHDAYNEGRVILGGIMLDINFLD